MAKNRKKKAEKSDNADSKSSASSTPSTALSQASSNVPTTAAEIAFARGNFSAVHAMAKQGDESAKKLLPLTTVDMGQVACGIVALAIVATIAMFTLGQ